MKMMLEFFEKKNWKPAKIAFYQAASFIVYASLVSFFMFNAGKIFGNNPTFFGPLALLTLFVFSAILSALLLLGYPFILFWEKKDTQGALKLVIKTAEWLFVFLVIIFAAIAIF